MLKAGMVGVGCISKIYLKNFAEVFKDIELVAVCDLIEERAQNAKDEYNIPKLYKTMDELFTDPEIDIVLNLTRPYQHYEVSKAALLAGKHVYSEKPLGADLDEGIELVKLAEEKGLLIGGAPDTFMGAGIQTCRKLIDNGLIGSAIGGRFAFASHGVETWHPDPDFYFQRGGGPLLDMGPYYITALINLLGGIKSVSAYSSTAFSERLITSEPHKGETIIVNTPTHYEAFITLESDVTVSLLTSFDVYNTKQPRIEIYGTKGTLYVPEPNTFGGTIEFFDGETKELKELPLEFDYSENSRCLGLADMAKAISDNRPGRTTYLQTFHVLEAMCGIMKSAETGMPYTMATKYTRTQPMDPTLPHGVL